MCQLATFLELSYCTPPETVFAKITTSLMFPGFQIGFQKNNEAQLSTNFTSLRKSRHAKLVNDVHTRPFTVTFPFTSHEKKQTKIIEHATKGIHPKGHTPANAPLHTP